MSQIQYLGLAKEKKKPTNKPAGPASRVGLSLKYPQSAKREQRTQSGFP